MSSKTKKNTLFSTFVASLFNTTRKNNKNSSDKNSPKPTSLSPRTRKIKLETLARKSATRKIGATLKRSFSSKLRKLKENKLAKLLAKHNIQETLCNICLADVEDVNNATITSCNHLFHTDCIRRWLLEPISRNKCPTCKRQLVAQSGVNLSTIVKLRNQNSGYNQEKHNDLIEKLRNSRNSQAVVLSDFKWVSQKVGPADRPIISGMITEGENLYHRMVKMIEIYLEIFPQQKTNFNSRNSESDAISSMSIANKNMTEPRALSLMAVNGQKTVDAIEAINEEPLLISLKQIAKRILATSA